MGVRVKIRVKLNREEVEAAALVNTGFETEQPEILLPVKLAERLGLYPPARNSTLE
jgi:predicted aspartyl protease